MSPVREAWKGVHVTDLAPKLTKTLLLTIAVPDVWAEDMTHESAQEFYGGDFHDMAYDSMALISSTVRVFVATGDKGGNDLHDMHGIIVGFEVDGRDPKYEEPEDERLTDMIDEWAENHTSATDQPCSCAPSTTFGSTPTG